MGREGRGGARAPQETRHVDSDVVESAARDERRAQRQRKETRDDDHNHDVRAQTGAGARREPVPALVHHHDVPVHLRAQTSSHCNALHYTAFGPIAQPPLRDTRDRYRPPELGDTRHKVT